MRRRLMERQNALQPRAAAHFSEQEKELLREHSRRQQSQITSLSKNVEYLTQQLLSVRMRGEQLELRGEQLERLLRNVCDGLTLLGITVPGYDEAAAVLTQIDILAGGAPKNGETK